MSSRCMQLSALHAGLQASVPEVQHTRCLQRQEMGQLRAARTALELAEAQRAKQGTADREVDFVWPLDAITLEASFPEGLQLREAAHFEGLGVVRCWHRALVQALACRKHCMPANGWWLVAGSLCCSRWLVMICRCCSSCLWLGL